MGLFSISAVILTIILIFALVVAAITIFLDGAMIMINDHQSLPTEAELYKEVIAVNKKTKSYESKDSRHQIAS